MRLCTSVPTAARFEREPLEQRRKPHPRSGERKGPELGRREAEEHERRTPERTQEEQAGQERPR